MNISTISTKEQEVLLRNARAAVSIFSNDKFKGFFTKEDLEDIVGNAMYKACRSLESYDSKFALSTWVSRIAVRCVLDAARKKAKHKPVSNPMVEFDEDGDEFCVFDIYGSCGHDYEADRYVDYDDFERCVRTVTDRIEGKRNKMFFKMIENGLGPKEMAAEAGCTADAAAIRKCKILKGIKEPIRQIALEFDVHNTRLAC